MRARNIDKLKVIETLSTENVKVESVGKQSIKVEHSCGCYFVEHLIVEKNYIKQNESEHLEKTHFVELCSEHTLK